jgi:hypothetical protein
MADSIGSADGAAPAPAPTVVFKKRGARPKENIRKREKPQSESESSSDDDDLPVGGRRAKRRQQGLGGMAGAAALKADDDLFRTTFEADRNKDLAASNDATREKTKIGPTHVATNVRSTTMMDYAPDVCKDVCAPPTPGRSFACPLTLNM